MLIIHDYWFIHGWSMLPGIYSMIKVPFNNFLVQKLISLDKQ